MLCLHVYKLVCLPASTLISWDDVVLLILFYDIGSKTRNMDEKIKQQGDSIQPPTPSRENIMYTPISKLCFQKNTKYEHF